MRSLPDITLDTEPGPMRINQYINNKQNWGFYGDDFEISIAVDLYGINIATYNENDNNGFNIIRYYNNIDENRHLLILSNINNLHFRLLYYNPNENLDLNFIIPTQTTENNNILDEEIKKENNNKIENCNKNISNLEIIKILNGLNNLDLENIIAIYSDDNNKLDYSDIYIYKYYQQKSINGYGKYSDKFKRLYKGENYKSKKLLLRKKCKKYNIDNFNRLNKRMIIKNIFFNHNQLKELLIIPNKYIKQILNYYHSKNGHKNYLILVNDIINAGFYCNNLYRLSRNYIKECIICCQNKKNIFKKPSQVNIFSNNPKDIYQMDITQIPELLRTNKDANYLLTIIDHFSRYAYAYILKYKNAESVLVNFKHFVNIHGFCKKLQTDNGKEFCNKLISSYCCDNEVTLIHGRPYHPQTQGSIEAFNKEIKKILENLYLENKKDFDIFLYLPDALNIYNNNIHSVTKMKPSELFKTKDDKIIRQALLNIKKYNKKFKKSDNGFKIGTKCLLSNKFDITGKYIKYKKFKRKGKYTIPCTIKGIHGSNDYIINFPLKISGLKPNKDYIANYLLLVECNINIWKEILNNLLKNI